jgi:hypothetical protein
MNPFAFGALRNLVNSTRESLACGCAREGPHEAITLHLSRRSKMLTTPNIVHSIEEERAITGTASIASDTAEGHEPVRAGAEAQGATHALGAWQPGTPVITEKDRAEWQTWRRERILKLQRERRRGLRRIDYYPSEIAAAIIDESLTRRVGGDASSILDRIVTEWAASVHSGIK